MHFDVFAPIDAAKNLWAHHKLKPVRKAMGTRMGKLSWTGNDKRTLRVIFDNAEDAVEGRLRF